MMKKIIPLITFFFLSTIVYSQDGFKLKVKINNPHNYTMYIAYNVDGKYVMDTAFVMEKGWAVLSGSVKEPVVASFGVRGNPELQILTGKGMMMPGPNLNFFLSNDIITIKGDANTVYKAKVKGGKANKEWNRIKTKEDNMVHQGWEAVKKGFATAAVNGDSSELNAAFNLRSRNGVATNNLRKDFIAKYPNSIVSMYFLSGLVNSLEFEDLKSSYSKLGTEFKTSVYGKRIHDKIASLEATAAGAKAIPINKKDINGNVVDLNKLKGKVVLLDFWGSWCVPCRQSFPHLKELYSKYKDDGFEILGIAQEGGQTIEESRKAWKKAIEEDGLPWLQVLNNAEVDKFDVVKAYGVTAFPTQILLDAEGKVVVRYVGESKDLDQRLKEIFGK